MEYRIGELAGKVHSFFGRKVRRASTASALEGVRGELIGLLSYFPSLIFFKITGINLDLYGV